MTKRIQWRFKRFRNNKCIDIDSAVIGSHWNNWWFSERDD